MTSPETEPTKAPESSGAKQPKQGSLSSILTLSMVAIVLGSLAGWLAFTSWREPDSLSTIQQVVAQGEWSKAEKLLRRSLERAPNDPAAMLLLGRVIGAQGAFVQCAELLQSVPADSTQRRNALLGAGMAWKEAKRRRAAERAWLDCLAQPHGDLEPPTIEETCLRQLCEMYAMERRRGDLWASTWRLHTLLAPRRRHEPLVMRARYHVAMVAPSVALNMLQPAADVDPKDLFTQRAIGLYRLEANQAEPARARLYQCVLDDGNEPLLWEAWCECLHRTGDLFGLKRATAQLPPAADASARCWKYRAIVAENNNELDQAIAALDRAIELEPDEPELHHRVGQLLLRVGRASQGQQHLTRNQEMQQAAESLRTAFDAYRNFWSGDPGRRPEIAHQFAVGYEKLGRQEDSSAWYRVALAEDPTHGPSIAGLERLQSSSGSTTSPGR